MGATKFLLFQETCPAVRCIFFIPSGDGIKKDAAAIAAISSFSAFFQTMYDLVLTPSAFKKLKGFLS